MRIGFDAKRAYYNRSGLGSYSRNTLMALATYFPNNEYYLFTPSLQKALPFAMSQNTVNVTPAAFMSKLFPRYWRSVSMGRSIAKHDIDIYHGLSNELPTNIARSGAQSVITIHDLIFMRYPDLYEPVDRMIYESKFKIGSQKADMVIAISQQTKNDLVEYLKIPAEKIQVVYQTYNPIYDQKTNPDAQKHIRQQYNLPNNYILFVGTIEKRKNVKVIIDALHTGKIDIPIVLVGKPTEYLNDIKAAVQHYNMQKQVLTLHNVPDEHLPALYQMADVFVYPSVFEGFGIPILEALVSATPVITTAGGVFTEAGGDAAMYVTPDSPDEVAAALQKILSDATHRSNMIQKGLQHAQRFGAQVMATQLMGLYNQLSKK